MREQHKQDGNRAHAVKRLVSHHFRFHKDDIWRSGFQKSYIHDGMSFRAGQGGYSRETAEADVTGAAHRPGLPLDAPGHRHKSGR